MPDKMIFLVLILLASPFDPICGQQNVAAVSKPTRQAIMPTDQAIKKFAARVQQSAQDIGSRSILGQLYLRRAKEEDRFHDFVAAEKQFASILETNPDNHSAKILLAYSYLSQHRFKEAKELTGQLLASNPNDKTCLAIHFDALMQLGDYEMAKQQIDSLMKISDSASAWVRLAAYQETFGQTQQALQSMQTAIEKQTQLGDVKERNAWYFLRYAQMLFDAGKIDTSEQQIHGALAAMENYPQALVLLARIKAVQGEKDEAVALYKRALTESEEPPTLVALGNIQLELGQADEAKKLFARAEKMMEEEEQDALAGPPHARERSVYYADHNKRLEHAVKLAQGDLSVRQDIVTHDTLAWALYQNQKPAAALDHARQATATGTRNASILFHAGLIEIANNHPDRGRELLQLSLASNPYFSSKSAEKIRQILNENQPPASKSTKG